MTEIVLDPLLFSSFFLTRIKLILGGPFAAFITYIDESRISCCQMLPSYGFQLFFCLPRGTHHWVPRTQRLFGGQIVGQALVAAAKSVSDHHYAHSLHCYFVRAGKMKITLNISCGSCHPNLAFSP